MSERPDSKRSNTETLLIGTLQEFKESYKNDIKYISQMVDKVASQQETNTLNIARMVSVVIGDEAAGTDGLGKRVQKIEAWKSGLAKTVGIIAGIAFVLGVVITFVARYII